MPDLTHSWFGYLSLVIFAVAYGLVITEEKTHLRKSTPVLIAGGVIWILVGAVLTRMGLGEKAQAAAEHMIMEYGELLLFLLVAMTYVNSMQERRIFSALSGRLVDARLSYRGLFWLTGILSFFLSALLDNMTTALIMGSVVLAIGEKSPRFIALGCINIVVASNAGGAFCPFGDITTLMVWQKDKLQFMQFFALFIPSLVNWLVPAVIMSLALPKTAPEAHAQKVTLKPGAWGVVIAFACTVLTTVAFRNFLNLPPAMGMMLGLGYLMVLSYVLHLRSLKSQDDDMGLRAFQQIEKVEWDTLLFFFGIIFAVGGLGVFGYLNLASTALYTGLGPTAANVTLGAGSAILDNIPLMYAVLAMNPTMSEGQWLLITLTTGVGGSMLSVGSAAGVALMGQAQGRYSFSSHLKWSWAIALGYVASIAVHFLINADTFS